MKLYNPSDFEAGKSLKATVMKSKKEILIFYFKLFIL